jgi:transcription elongation factor GreA-like protein
MSEAFGVNLKEKAVAGDRDNLEEAWLEALEKPGPASDFLDALDALEQGMRKECSLALLPLVIETYDGLGRYEDSLQVCRRMVQYKSIDRAMRRILVRSLRETYKGTDWIEAFLHATGLLEGDPMDACMERFDAYLPYRPGCGAIHGSGWGSGVVEGFNEDTWEIRVRFEDGCKRELPLSSAVDNLRPLNEGDLRIMVMVRPDELREMAQKDPALAIRKALELRPKVKLSAAKVKEILVGQVVPQEEWSRWWTRAKQAAAKDPYLHLEGGSRPIFQLRDKPVSIQEEAMASLEGTADLTETVEKVRE